MRLILGEYILDINVEENKNFYNNEICVSEGCNCDGCNNYEKAVERVSEETKKLFERIGVDIKKPAEVYVNYSEDDILYYGGFYHISGRIITGESPWKLIQKTEETTTSQLAENNMISIGENFKVAFQGECALISENFPKPSVQMEISAYLPWVLDKPNTY